ncbi:MAG: DUF4328 domain-containing protein [Actinomycetota bacterium]|nr:DUF4328 domain-containing protein [Actinomycetota bacterium]
MSGGGAPAGWYPDPWQPSQRRWWDGTAWTGYVAPPTAPVAAAVPPHLDDQERRGTRARVALLVAVPFLVVDQAALVWMIRVLVDRVNDGSFTSSSSERFYADFTSAFAGPQLLSRLASLGYLVAAVLFLLWFFRACADGRALGLASRREPGIATASFLIPVVNLWWPYQSTCDLLPADHPARRHVLRWWLLWTVGGSVAGIAVIVGAVVSARLGWILVALPAVQGTCAALAARQVVSDLSQAHRALAGAAPGP